MYNYKAYVTNIVDGDTFDATVQLGFTVSVEQRFRLKDIDTPETWRPKTEAEREHGKRATAFVTPLLLNQEIVLTSVKSAVYNRYEAYVTLPDGSDLGQLLIENNLVKLDNYEDIDDSI
jgi:micrococcal nuclease